MSLAMDVERAYLDADAAMVAGERTRAEHIILAAIDRHDALHYRAVKRQLDRDRVASTVRIGCAGCGGIAVAAQGEFCRWCAGAGR